MESLQVVILAAGQGKRMNHATLPKVLVPLHGKPMVQYLLDAIEKSGVCEKPIMVIGQKAELVRQTIENQAEYVIQSEQLGTGHAVSCAREQLAGRFQDILVLPGDNPFVSADTIRGLAEVHHNTNATITMATFIVNDFNGWRHGFADFGRIIRDPNNNIVGIVEKKDASPEELLIMELNPGFYCFKADWLWQNLSTLTKTNAQGEYYITDLIKKACDDHEPLASVAIQPQEGLGINTAEQLKLAAQL